MKNESCVIILPLPKKVLQPNCTIATISGRMMKSAAIKRYRRITKEVIESEQIESAPWKKMIVKATFFHKNRRKRDEDNSMGSLKAAYDGIVDTGLICNDDYEHMKRESPKFRIDKNNPRVELELIRCS